jgi:phosphatidylglycerol---prolipoprotein diacylglyceryl transferase
MRVREGMALERPSNDRVARPASRLTLRPYPTLLGIGSIIGIVTATRLAPWIGLAPGRTYVALVLLLIPALVGSRLLFVLMHWPRFRGNVRSIWRTNDGGLALYGGLVLTLVTSLLLLPALQLQGAAFWDAGTVVILIGMAFTKVGCHLTGCCAGRVSTSWWALESTDARGQRTRRLPAQLLESALAVVLLGVALVVRRELAIPGSVFLTGAIGYGIGRFLLEGVRETAGRERDVWVNRAISATLSASAAVALWLSSASR